MKPVIQKKKSIMMVIAFGLVACILYGVGAGLRSDIGILLNPLAEHADLQYDDVSLCIAVMQLIFGAVQPVFGIIAGRRSNRFVLIIGAILLGCSMLGMIFSSSFIALMISLGVLFGLGAGALAFGLILTSAIHFVGRNNAMLISGMLNAAAGMVGFILSPLLQAMLGAQGLIFTLIVLIGMAAALVPIVFVVTSRDHNQGDQESEKENSNNSRNESVSGNESKAVNGTGLSLFKEAIANRTFRLLFAGFTTCGFHMVIIESHLFSQFTLYGLDEVHASWAFSVYGIATIAGALFSGFLSARLRKGRLLGFYYGFRAVWVIVYLLLLPKTMTTAILFSVGLGLTGDATVSPTSGLVSENFRIGNIATLIGVLFFTHQIGAFLSAWLGGIIRETTGGYAAVWMIDIALCAFACVMSLRIREQK